MKRGDIILYKASPNVWYEQLIARVTHGIKLASNEQAMQWCRAREISVNFVEVPGKARLYFKGDLLMEGETLQGAIAKVKRYSRAPLPRVGDASKG